MELIWTKYKYIIIAAVVIVIGGAGLTGLMSSNAKSRAYEKADAINQALLSDASTEELLSALVSGDEKRLENLQEAFSQTKELSSSGFMKLEELLSEGADQEALALLEEMSADETYAPQTLLIDELIIALGGRNS